MDPNASMPAEPPQRASQPIPLRTLLVPSASSQQQQPVLVPSAVKTVLGSVGAISTQQQSAQQQSLASEAEVKAAILRELRKPGKSKISTRFVRFSRLIPNYFRLPRAVPYAS